MLVLAVLALVLYLLFTVVLHNTTINSKAEKALRENAKLESKVNQQLKELENVTNRSGHRSQPNQ